MRLCSWLVLLLLPVPIARAQPAPLPEGNTGLASRHANDQGIEGEPGVVLHENFESVVGGVLGWDSQWDNVFGDLPIVTAAAKVHAGSQALEIAHDEAERNHGAWRDFGTAGFESLFLRYYIKFDAQFPGVHHSGMGLMAGAPGVNQGSATGVRPDGSNHYIVLLDAIAPFFSWAPANSRPPGYSYLYCYHMDQADVWGDVFLPSGTVMPGGRDLFGDDFVPRTDVIVDLDRWYSFELMVQANTPGQSDGRLAFWIDGVLAADFLELRFRTDPDLDINFINLGSYTSTLYPNQTLWYDDIVAATSYIGPMVTAVVVTDASTPDAQPAADGATGSDSARPDAADRDVVRNDVVSTDAGPAVDSSAASDRRLDRDAGAAADAGSLDAPASGRDARSDQDRPVVVDGCACGLVRADTSLRCLVLVLVGLVLARRWRPGRQPPGTESKRC